MELVPTFPAQALRIRPAHVGRVLSVDAVHHDEHGLLLISAGTDGTVHRWSATSGHSLGSPLECGQGWIYSVTVSRTDYGSILVFTAGADGTVRAWDVITGARVGSTMYHTLTLDASARLIGGIEALGIRVGAKGALLFAGDSLGNLTTWDLTSCAYVSQIKAHDGPIKDLSVLGGSQSYGHIATAGSDGYIRGWRVGQHESQFELEVGEGGASALAWKQAPKGPSILVAGDSDGSIHRWDLETKKALETVIKAHVGAVQCLTAGYLHRDTAVVLTGGQDGFARMWDLVSGAPLGQPRVPHRGKVQAIATTSDHGNALEIITGGDDGVIRRWDASNGEAIGSPLVGHNAGVRHLILCPMLNNTVLASYGEDHSLRFWSLSTGGAVGDAFGLDLDDRELIESSRLLFTLELPRDRRPHPGHPQWLWRGGDFFANRILVTLIGLGGIERWDLRSGQRLGPMTLLNERVESSAAPYISDLVGVPGDRGEEPLLVSVTADGLLQTFDAFTGQPRGAPVPAMGLDARLKLDRDVHLSLPASSRSTVVVSGDRSFSVWDACSGEQITAPTRFPPGITGKRIAAMALSDGRTLLVVEGRDGYIHRMDAKTTTRVGTSLPTHLGEVSAIAVAAWPWALDYDGWLVVSGGTDGTVVIWPLDMSGGLIGDPKPRTAGSAVASACLLYTSD